MALEGVSSRLVHACGTHDSSSSAPIAAARTEYVTDDLVIGRSSERDPQAARDGTGPRIAEIVDAAHAQALIAGLDFRIVPRIPGQQEQIVARHVGPGAPRPRESGERELVLH